MLHARLASNRAVRLLVTVSAVLLGVTACTSGGGSKPSNTPQVDGRPNIVFVLTDDLSTNLVPYMPHVQSLMLSGMSFRNFFAVDSLCCPSRASIFTGQYPHNTGVVTNEAPDGGYYAFGAFGNKRKSFAVALQRAGYRTGFIGKYLNGYEPRDPPPPGWDDWVGADGAYQEYNYDLNESGNVHSYGDSPEDYLTDVLAGKARDFIASAADSGQPFALEVSTFAPHQPSQPAARDVDTFPSVRAPRGPAFNRTPTDAPRWLARLKPLAAAADARMDEDFRRRVESVQAVDRMIGGIERKLAARHELTNTYFLFSSDNGFHLGDYRMRRGKQTAFDPDIRVPLVVSGPGVPAGRTTAVMASNIDLAPTFLQIAGARPTDVPDGVSLLDLWRGQPAPETWQRAVLIEHHGPATDPSDPDRQPASSGKPPSYEAIRSDRFLYVEYVTGEREYYDLEHDPYELHNLAGSLPQDRLNRLHTQLQRLVACQGAAQCQRAAALIPAR
jgi:arylsulfatase A-like enzyme